MYLYIINFFNINPHNTLSFINNGKMTPAYSRDYIVSITELGIEKVDKIYTYYLSPIYKLRKVLGNQDFFELMSYIQKANEKMNQDKEE